MKDKLEMFNIDEQKKRIGEKLNKSKLLDDLKQVEEYLVEQAEIYKFETAYDVTAAENPSFHTLSYTEWGSNFIVFPLNNDLRRDMILDSLLSPEDVTIDWEAYYKGLIESKNANKYQDRKLVRKQPRESLIVPVGTNKFMDVIDIDKLITVCENESAYIKPHPLTTHEYVGFMMDKCGEDNVLSRDHDLYEMMVGADKVYTTHYSESMLYAAMLGKDIDVVDKLGKHYQAGFWHFNQHMLRTPKEARIPQLNKILNSFHCGVFNPRIDKDWKSKMDKFLLYMEERRAHFSGFYLNKPKK